MEWKWLKRHGLDLKLKLIILKQILSQIKWNKNKNTHSSISMKPKTHVLVIQDRMND